MPILTTGAGRFATAAAWTPLSLGSALIAWYKADAGAYKDAGTTLAANSETVQQWNDQSGNGYHLSQGDALHRPTFKTNTLNGLPVLEFDGSSSSHGLLTSSAPVILGGTHLSGFTVRKITGSVGTDRVLGITTAGSGDTGADTAIFEYCPASITTPTSYNNGVVSSGTVSSGTWNQLGSIWDGTNNTMYIGNVAQTPVGSTPTFAAAVDIEVFQTRAATGATSGQAAEIIITNTALSAGDRNSLASYLTGRWGV